MENRSRWWESPASQFPSLFLSDKKNLDRDRLANILANERPEIDSELITRIRRGANLLEMFALSQDTEDGHIDAWEAAAIIHEALGVINREEKVREWLLSMLEWQLCEAPAVAFLLAESLRKEFGVRNLNGLQQIVAAFSSRNMDELNSLAQSEIISGQKLYENAHELQSYTDSIASSIHLALGNAFKELVDYVQFRTQTLPVFAGLTDFLNLSSAVGRSEDFRLARLLLAAAKKFAKASSRFLIQTGELTDTAARDLLLRYLANYPELWPSQKEAIDKGLLRPDTKHFVVSAPTSSGKTLCGELAIIQALSINPTGICFYVVPTRALVEEKSAELSAKLRPFGFTVKGALSALQINDAEVDLLGDCSVVVCTPEKLDLLVRNKDDLISRACLFVIDEAHMISDEGRGLGLEFVIIKVLILQPNARIILLSATLPNAEDFARWLSRDSASLASTSWRPTRQRFGELIFSGQKPSGSILEMKFVDRAGEYEGLAIELARYSRRPRSIKEMVVWATKALGSKGPVLVFSMSKSRCEEIVENLLESNLDQQAELIPQEIVDLQKKIRREISADFLLARSLQFGVAYHHADLPPRIRIELERIIEKGILNVVVCTTTLAEGVNLPISSVLFEDWMTRGDARPQFQRKPEPLDLYKFRNIAGRAGRAGKESEGLILFLEPARKKVVVDSEEMEARKYFLRETYPPVLSRFLQIVNKYKIPDDADLDRAWERGDRWNPEVRSAINQFSLAVLHAVEVLGGGENEFLDQIMENSLFSIQAPDKVESGKQWLGLWTRFYDRVQLPFKELRGISMEVGLQLRSMKNLFVAINEERKLSLFFEKNSIRGRLNDSQVDLLADLILSIEEFEWLPK